MLLPSAGEAAVDTARTLQGVLFAGPDGLLVVDCQSHSGDDAVPRLVGERGVDWSGALSRPLAARGGRVVLFQAIERAHFDVHDLVLTMLDLGRIRGPAGQQLPCVDTLLAISLGGPTRSRLVAEILAHAVDLGGFLASGAACVPAAPARPLLQP